jgi:hypothetical protein
MPHAKRSIRTTTKERLRGIEDLEGGAGCGGAGFDAKFGK